MQTTRTDTTIIKEGGTSLFVPAFREPQRVPFFFNPKGAFVRDVSIICYKSYADLFQKPRFTFADALAGVGARGVRVASEVGSCSKVFLNDTNSSALALARDSAELNKQESKCIFSKMEACSFLVSRSGNNNERFDVVDIDPFGTPSQFVDCAIRAVKHEGLLSLTATDSGVLCGVYPKVCKRKYMGLPLRTDYCHEIGLRLMFGLLASTAMRLEAGILPLFSHHDVHYLRTYAQIKVGNRYARESETNMGYVVHCFRCGFRSVLSESELFSDAEKCSKKFSDALSHIEKSDCPNCFGSREGKIKIGGPCWIGNIQCVDFVKKCADTSKLSIFSEDELDLPLYYDLTTISKGLGSRTPKITDVMNDLVSSGFRVSRTRLNPTALRTDAPLQHLQSVVARLVR